MRENSTWWTASLFGEPASSTLHIWKTAANQRAAYNSLQQLPGQIQIGPITDADGLSGILAPKSTCLNNNITIEAPVRLTLSFFINIC